jgi:hypothetical protein
MTVLIKGHTPAAAAMQAGLPVRVRLPAGGWQVGFLVQPDGRTVVEVIDPSRSVAARVASAGSQVLSIDAGWVGKGPGRQWWALAIGRAPAAAGQPAVTFTRNARRGRMAPPQEAVDGLWAIHDGLWVAAATGRYTHVRLAARSTTRVRRLRLVTGPRE